MSKKIFVTGGAGFIGSAVVNHLSRSGYEILIYDNLSFGDLQFVKAPGHQFVRGDILDSDLLKLAMVRFSPQCVIHLAAIHFIPYCNEHPFESANINIKGTSNVLEVCRILPDLEKVFFASTAAVYPIYDGAITETLPPGPTDIYGLSKFAGEAICGRFQAETCKPTIICRFFNAFGPNETNPHLIPAIQQQVMAGKRTVLLGNTEPKRDFIHTADMARAVQLLLEKFDNGLDIFNLGRGIEYSVLEVIDGFARALGEKVAVATDPSKLRKSDRLHLLADISKITSFAGWKPEISLEDGIRTLVQK